MRSHPATVRWESGSRETQAIRAASDGLDRVPVNFSVHSDRSVAACATERSYLREVSGALPDSYHPLLAMVRRARGRESPESTPRPPGPARRLKNRSCFTLENTFFSFLLTFKTTPKHRLKPLRPLVHPVTPETCQNLQNLPTTKKQKKQKTTSLMAPVRLLPLPTLSCHHARARMGEKVGERRAWQQGHPGTLKGTSRKAEIRV